MTTADETAHYCADLVSGLADAGVDRAFISPGSRNTPLTLAFSREPRINDALVRDERSAAFVALGYGKATGRPAAVLCTSGSAATHYFPAVVEADQSAAPLIVFTADRPARLRGTSAPQTMDQINLFGGHVKSFTDLDVRAAGARSEGRMLTTLAIHGPAGPVHANISFEEPLLPPTLPDVPEPAAWDLPNAAAADAGSIVDSLVGRDVLIIAGGRHGPGFGEALSTVAATLGAVVLSDPQCWIDGPNAVSFGDVIASTSDALDRARPDVVLRLGAIPTSKPLWTWLEESSVEQIHVTDSRLRDPLGSATVTIDSDPTTFLAGLPSSDASEGAFLGRWRSFGHAAASAISEAVGGLPFPNEPMAARLVVEHVAAASSLFLGSSMPIRDVDAFAVPRSDIAVFANRGVNGIDGSISTALGLALATGPTTALIGDISALHDATALSEAVRLGARLRLVVINNDGGGIFSFLPQAREDLISPEIYERHWGTPHGLSLASIAEGFGLTAARVDSLDQLRDALARAIDGPELIELHTDRTANRDHHRSIRRAVRSSLDE